MNPDPPGSDIFISYAHEDRARVAPLVAALENRSWIVFWDRAIPIGQRFDTFLQETLNNTRCVVVLWSESSIKSEWVSIEADEAKARGILVPARIDEVNPPLAFRRTQTADLADWHGEPSHPEFERLLKSLTRILTGKPDPVAGPAPDANARDPRVPERSHARRRTVVTMLGILIPLSIAVAMWTFHPAPVTPADRSSKAVAPPAVGEMAVAGALRESQSAILPKPRPERVNTRDGLKSVFVPPTPAAGFRMGCSNADRDCSPDEVPHQVRITKGFWLGETEVTQDAFRKVMSGATPSQFKGANWPVDSVSWTEARDYCRKTGGRLPTEAEWEWAARAETSGALYGDLDRIAWSGVDGSLTTHAVGLKEPNAWGLRDMPGNVWEWVADWYAAYPQGSSVDPTGPRTGRYRVRRGGSFASSGSDVRVSYRADPVEPAGRFSDLGFRCAGD